MVSAAGCQTTKVGYIPRQSKGPVELNVKMEPKASPDNTVANPFVAAASRPGAPGSGSAPTDSAKPTFFLLGVCFGLAAISAVVRTAGKREGSAAAIIRPPQKPRGRRIP